MEQVSSRERQTRPGARGEGELKRHGCAIGRCCDLPASPSRLSRDSSMHLPSTEEREEAYLEIAEGRKVLGGGGRQKTHKREEEEGGKRG